MTQIATDRGQSTVPPEWNSTARAYPLVPLHETFETVVERTPDAPAIRFREETLTYRQLDERANRLARHLVKLGSRSDAVVAICMDRSLEMVVALYAALKSGAAYLPIDPEYPPERISFMLDDADALALLTQGPLAPRFEDRSMPVISVDRMAEQLAGLPGDRPPARASLDDLAYVIYTSGSTGQPKGAMVSHRAIANRMWWMQEAFELTPADRVLQKTPFSFDVSVWEFFWPLLFGAQLEVAEPGGHRDSAYLAKTIMERHITTIHFVPSMLQLFLEDPRAGYCTSLTRVICSGEALPRGLQDRFFGRLDAELHNLYGPTEAAVDVTAWACDPQSSLPFVPIGKPIANTQIHILDEAMQPVPVGEAGELHIGGVQLARGYLNRPELTAERFIKDPFTHEPGARLYKTGDLARYLPGGAIEFLGRADFQVKVRGFRVELGEIEAALETIEGVRQAIVAAHQRSSGDVELVAYLAGPVDEGPSNEVIRAQLAERLPEYMVPTTCIRVERFHLTSNGKVDRKALPVPARVRPALGAAYVAPRSALERLIVEKWRSILDLDRVGVNDRFFELGGSSLQAARFVNEMQAELDESIFVVSLFSASSVAEYAAFLENGYPAAVKRLIGIDAAPTPAPATAAPAMAGSPTAKPIVEADLAAFRSIIPVLGEAAPETGPRNPPAVFILSPPRSGTTLLRIMLAGHAGLFSASELQLLGFSTLQERAAAYSGTFSGWLDGAVRALMQIEGIEAHAARARIRDAEERGLTTKQFYRQLQESVQPRILVDKSPSYALDPAALHKAEADFESPRYVHLVRHPLAMVDSFERHHMEQVLYLHEHDYPSRQLAELVWVQSHRTILDFLAGVPEERWVRIGFERLVREPEAEMERLCARLGLAFDSGVLQPYDALDDKMIDGVFSESAPMGDPGFLGHGSIDVAMAEVPHEAPGSAPLGEPTRKLATVLGYDRTTRVGRHRSGDRGSAKRAALTRQRDLRRASRERRS